MPNYLKKIRTIYIIGIFAMILLLPITLFSANIQTKNGSKAQIITNCAPNPSKCGFPDSTNTGVSAGITLRKVPQDVSSGTGWHWDTQGVVVVDGNGAVVEGLDLTNDIDVQASNVTIRNNRIIESSNGAFGISLRHTANVTISHNEIHGTNTSSGRMLTGVKDIYGDSKGTQVLANNISAISTGVQMEEGLIQDNYIHDMGYISGDHINGTTSNGGTTLLTINHNTIFNQVNQTDAISLFQDFGDQQNRTITNNLIAGGGYTVYGGSPGPDCQTFTNSQGCFGPSANIKINNNRFAKIYYPNSGSFGYLAYFNDKGQGNEFAGNVWDDTGELLPGQTALPSGPQPTIAPISTIKPTEVIPTLYCLGSCPSTQPTPSTSVTTIPSLPQQSPEVSTTVSPTAPCGGSNLTAETATKTATSGKKHKIHTGAITSFMDQFLQILIQLIQFLLQLLGSQVPPIINLPTPSLAPSHEPSTIPTQIPCEPTIRTSIVPSVTYSQTPSQPQTTVKPSTPAPTLPTTASCTSNVWNSLEACGWPGATNTGYPTGTNLTNTTGKTITANNTVITNEKISGRIYISAQNVTIKNSWIISTGGGTNGTGVIEVNPGASVTVDHVTIDGGNNAHACIWYKGNSLTVTAVNCFGVNDGFFSWQDSGGTTQGNNFTIQDSYVHDLTTATGNGHIDGYQTEGATNGTIKHNTIDINQAQNAAVSIWNSYKSSDNISVENNLLAGGGFTVYAEDYNPSETNPAGGFSVTNIRFINNKFSNVHYPCVGYYGIWYPRGAPTDKWNRSGNILLETGVNVDNGNPTVNGSACN